MSQLLPKLPSAHYIHKYECGCIKLECDCPAPEKPVSIIPGLCPNCTPKPKRPNLSFFFPGKDSPDGP